MNELFAAWVETAYHQRIHPRPSRRPWSGSWPPGPPSLRRRQLLREAFLWSDTPHVTKTATVSLHGNPFEVDAALVGRHVECVFDPFDLTTLEVRYQGRPMGTASRTGSAATPTPRPARTGGAHQPRRPGSTTSTCSPRSTAPSSPP